MKKKFVSFLFFLLFNKLAYAHHGDQYLLPKFGFMAIQQDQPTPLWSVGLLVGYGLTNRMSLEGEANVGFSGGRYEKHQKNTSNINEKGDYKIVTAAVYGVYRYPLWQGGYIKSKLGLLWENVTRNIERDGKRIRHDLGAAGGLGFGAVILGTTTLELEATIIDKDIIFYSLGTHIHF